MFREAGPKNALSKHSCLSVFLQPGLVSVRLQWSHLREHVELRRQLEGAKEVETEE